MTTQNLARVTNYSVFISLFIGVLLFLSGEDLSSSLRVSAVILVQTFPGILFWILFSPKKAIPFPELFGMGFAFGSLFTVFSAITLRSLGYQTLSWMLPFAISALALMIPKVRAKVQSFRAINSKTLELAFISSSFLFAIALFWIWVLPLAIAPYFLAFSKKKKFQIWAFLLIPTSIVASIFLRSSSTEWWLFSHDQVYLEGLSEGIFRYGPTENIHLVGHGYPYHWFSLLWSSVISHGASLPPFVALTKVLPLVALLICVLLIWAASIHYRKASGYVAVLFFVFASNAINWTPIRFVNSPTFLFSLIWLLAFAFLIRFAISNPSFPISISLAIFLIGSFGGKVTHGVVALGGLSGMGIYVLFKKHLRSFIPKLLSLYSILLIATVFVYLLAYRGERVGGKMLRLRPGELGFQVGIAYMSSSQWIWVVATVAVLIGCSSIFFVSLFQKKVNDAAQLFQYFCIGSYVISLALTLLLAQDGGSQGYFLLSAMVIAVIPASNAVVELVEQVRTEHKATSLLGIAVTSALFGLIAFYVWDKAIFGIDPYRAGLLIKISVLVLPTFALFVLVMKFGKHALSISLLSLVLISFSSGVTERIGIGQNYFRNFNQSEQIDPISGSPGRIEALTWLRENSSADDIVATNRFCIPGYEQCDMKWYLVSAISKRRMLVEGNREPVTDPNALINEKIESSVDFGRSPTQKSFEFLKMFGTKWFVVDTAAGPINSTWEPYASIEFKNSEMAVLRLAKSSQPLP